jgi:hypothetical protein
MAIFPYHSTTIINKDVLTASSFKAGMALIIDSNGRAIKADSQLLISTSVQEKYARFLGFAASDHDLSGNTLIVPDVIGSSYLDINNRFINNQNLEYSVPKRALMDLQDTAVSNFYNLSDPNVVSKRGIGVYNTPGDYFVTDQFVPVLHGDYGADGSQDTISPGDLLTFGGGSNAGKLVKVNINSFGSDIVVIGSVDRYVPSTGLLYFKQLNYRLSFGVNPYVLALDAGNLSSYSVGSTNTTNLVNGTSGGTLVNGTSYSATNSGAWVFDGTNDFINTSFSGSFASNATIVMWIQLDVENPPNSSLGGLLGFDDGGLVGPSYYPFWADGKAYINVFRNGRIGPITLGSTVKTQPHMVTITTDGTDWKFYQNTSLITTAVAQATVRLLTTYIGKGYYDVMFQGKVFQFSLLNQALTQTQITNYYNATRGRYGV